MACVGTSSVAKGPSLAVSIPILGCLAAASHVTCGLRAGPVIRIRWECPAPFPIQPMSRSRRGRPDTRERTSKQTMRAPRVLCRVRRPEPLTDVLLTRTHIEHEISRVLMADSTSCREARTSELGAERTYEVSDDSDTFVVHALPASVHRLRDSARIRTSLCPYVLSSQNPTGAL